MLKLSFKDYPQNPILSPTEGFFSKGIYNPTLIKEKETIFMLFRGESEDGVTGRIGLAKSVDGLHFEVYPQPVITPSEEFDIGGCEDPRLIKVGETFYLTYVGNAGEYGVTNLCMATSVDLLNWKKWGRVLHSTKSWSSGQIKAGAILPQKLGGRYIMYYMGEERPWKSSIGIAYSEDLINWYEGEGPVLAPSKDFDSEGVEPGPNPVLLLEGILLIYNGWGKDHIYKPGAALFSTERPNELLYRTCTPLFKPTKEYKRGKEKEHVVTEGLLMTEDEWLLYYGAADRYICLAIGKKE
jgi:predicted GH43/DUF377 family glycosyl hydrolase